MPHLAGFAPCYDPISLRGGRVRLHENVRPLFWWAKDLCHHGYVLHDVSFNASTKVASAQLSLPARQVVEVVRRHDDRCSLPMDLPALLVEAVWRLGVLGWSEQLGELIGVLAEAGLVSPRVVPPTPRCERPITGPGPGQEVRVAYWWAAVLIAHGWDLYACGEPIAQGGFIAEAPGLTGRSLLAVYPGGMADDGSEASALANQLARLDESQRGEVRRIVAAAIQKRRGE